MDAFTGEIRLFPYYNYSGVENWCQCDGRQLSIRQYQELATVIGDLYGGDRINYFNVPDLRGAAAMGAGIGIMPVGTSQQPLTPRTVGQKVGARTSDVTQNYMPAHTHIVNAATYTNSQNVDVPTVETVPSSPFGVKVYGPLNASDTAAAMGLATIGLSGSASPAVIPLNNMQPCLQIYQYYICLRGVYPLRS